MKHHHCPILPLQIPWNAVLFGTFYTDTMEHCNYLILPIEIPWNTVTI
jgi:hypothetical protein